jgi:nucleotide-binding universal stress UspA family protein
MKRLLIATDGSRASATAVHDGVELAHELGARVLFVFVKAWPSGLLGEPFYQRKLSHESADARKAVEEAMEVADEFGVEADWEILQGEPAREIIGLADERDADLIVVGSRGLGAVAGTLLGSISRAIVHEADRPVLVARPRARDRRPKLVAV